MLLTERETTVLKMTVAGFKEQVIAEKLGIKPTTVRAYKARIMRKYRQFGVRSFRELKQAIISLTREGITLPEMPQPPE